MRKWGLYVLFCWIIGFLYHFTLRPNKLNIQTLIHLKYSPIFPRGSLNLKTLALLYFFKVFQVPTISVFQFFFLLTAINFESQQVNLCKKKKKKNAIPRLIDWSEVRSDALFTLVAMATSILLTLAFNKPLSDCWKRAFHSTSFIFHGQINAETFFIGRVDAHYICNLNASEFAFKMQHYQPVMSLLLTCMSFALQIVHLGQDSWYMLQLWLQLIMQVCNLGIFILIIPVNMYEISIAFIMADKLHLYSIILV